jgi:asparagine synthase (glutamine-hydrolysing)
VELVEQLVWHHDGPFSDSSAIPTYLLSKLTREHVTVALTGDGGDELFAGYLRFYAAVLCERVPQWSRMIASRLFSRLPAWGHHRSAARRLQKFAASAALPFAERFSRWIAVFYEDLPRLLRQEGLANGHAPQPLAAIQPHLARARSASPLAQLLYLNLKTYLLDDLLVKMDRCSMAHALEARSPFLDSALLEYVFGLPDAMKLRWGRTKVILRQAFADLVPRSILRRGKMGFGVPLRMWFAEDLREYLHDVLLAPTARLRRYVDQAYVRELVHAHLAGEVDYSDRLWTLLTFEVWLRGAMMMPRNSLRSPEGFLTI